MIVTRSWLEEYIDLSDISNSDLVKRLNEIGLEVDGFKEYRVPSKVVVGEVKSCSKHPDANKLNVCEVDIGSETLQIVCGASNVVNAKYVAVATIGAVLPGDFKIKKAKLRGVESSGMICSSTELGLPELEDGIMILDDSIGSLELGRELSSYKALNDFVIEIGLTPNRGDCLSIYGVARDLAAAFKKELKSFDFMHENRSKIGIAKELKVECKDEFEGVVNYSYVTISNLKANLLTKLRAAFAEVLKKSDIETIFAYAIHSSGVILRGYDFEKLHKDSKGRVDIVLEKKDDYLVEVKSGNELVSILGAYANSEFLANSSSTKILLEASYVEPQSLIEGVTRNKIKTDELYYNASRGSEPNVEFGLKHLQKGICLSSSCEYSDSIIKIGKPIKPRKIGVNLNEIIDIIGDDIPKKDMGLILASLGYKMVKSSEDVYAIEIPPHAHDVKNIYDIAEEILRIYGIDNIKPKPLKVIEANRINSVYLAYKDRVAISDMAVGAGFFEALTYAFCSKEALQKYGFSVLKENLELINPIVKELNTLRPTLLLNLIEAASRNVKYGKKSIALFEIGKIFNEDRKESDAVAFIFSGEEQKPYVTNGAKAKIIDFASFTKKISSVIGEFELKQIEPQNKLMHPYQSGVVIKDEKEVGYIFKLHPEVAKEYDLSDTYLCELDFNLIRPKHKEATALSNFQPVTKDLSVVVDKNLSFYEVAKVLKDIKNNTKILKDFYPLDIYSDESLKDKKSLTIRFTLQSDEKTLSDEEIEQVMQGILYALEQNFGATLR